MDSITDIVVFTQVVTSKSFTAAAEQLGMSRPAVSKYVTALENRLGVRLLHRTTRRLSLTEAGSRFYETSRRALEAIDQAQQEITALQAAPKGRLRISAPTSFGIEHIAPLLPRLMTDYPDLQIDLSLEDRQVDLVEEGVDVALRIADLPDSSMVARPLAPCRYVLCASPAYFKHHAKPVSPSDLSRHRCLVFRFWDAPVQWQFKSPDGEFESVNVSGALSSNNSLALRRLLLEGAGITMAPTFLVGDYIKQGKLETALPGFSIQNLTIYAVYPHRRYLTPKVRVFLESLKHAINAGHPYWDRFN